MLIDDCNYTRGVSKTCKAIWWLAQEITFSESVLLSFTQSKLDFWREFVSPQCENGAWPSHATALKKVCTNPNCSASAVSFCCQGTSGESEGAFQAADLP